MFAIICSILLILSKAHCYDFDLGQELYCAEYKARFTTGQLECATSHTNAGKCTFTLLRFNPQRRPPCPADATRDTGCTANEPTDIVFYTYTADDCATFNGKQALDIFNDETPSETHGIVISICKEMCIVNMMEGSGCGDCKYQKGTPVADAKAAGGNINPALVCDNCVKDKEIRGMVNRFRLNCGPLYETDFLTVKKVTQCDASAAEAICKCGKCELDDNAFKCEQCFNDRSLCSDGNLPPGTDTLCASLDVDKCQYSYDVAADEECFQSVCKTKIDDADRCYICFDMGVTTTCIADDRGSLVDEKEATVTCDPDRSRLQPSDKGVVSGVVTHEGCSSSTCVHAAGFTVRAGAELQQPNCFRDSANGECESNECKFKTAAGKTTCGLCLTEEQKTQCLKEASNSLVKADNSAVRCTGQATIEENSSGAETVLTATFTNCPVSECAWRDGFIPRCARAQDYYLPLEHPVCNGSAAADSNDGLPAADSTDGSAAADGNDGSPEGDQTDDQTPADDSDENAPNECDPPCDAANMECKEGHCQCKNSFEKENEKCTPVIELVPFDCSKCKLLEEHKKCNAAKDDCVCVDGYKMKDNKCQKESGPNKNGGGDEKKQEAESTTAGAAITALAHCLLLLALIV